MGHSWDTKLKFLGTLGVHYGHSRGEKFLGAHLGHIREKYSWGTAGAHVGHSRGKNDLKHSLRPKLNTLVAQLGEKVTYGHTWGTLGAKRLEHSWGKKLLGAKLRPEEANLQR